MRRFTPNFAMAGIAGLMLWGCATAPRPTPEPLAAEAGCSAGPIAPPAEFAAWNAARPLVSARSTGALGVAQFAAGSAVDLRLHRDGEVAYRTLPKGAGEPGSFGGMARFRVARAGLYAIGQGGFAWVDVIRDDAGSPMPLPTIAFGHGPVCTGIRKVVTYQLAPGDYTLEISGSPSERLRVIVAG